MWMRCWRSFWLPRRWVFTAVIIYMTSELRVLLAVIVHRAVTLRHQLCSVPRARSAAVVARQPVSQAASGAAADDIAPST
jgi:hypothetical protein